MKTDLDSLLLSLHERFEDETRTCAERLSLELERAFPPKEGTSGTLFDWSPREALESSTYAGGFFVNLKVQEQEAKFQHALKSSLELDVVSDRCLSLRNPDSPLFWYLPFRSFFRLNGVSLPSRVCSFLETWSSIRWGEREKEAYLWFFELTPRDLASMIDAHFITAEPGWYSQRFSEFVPTSEEDVLVWAEQRNKRLSLLEKFLPAHYYAFEPPPNASSDWRPPRPSEMFDALGNHKGSAKPYFRFLEGLAELYFTPFECRTPPGFED